MQKYMMVRRGFQLAQYIPFTKNEAYPFIINGHRGNKGKRYRSCGKRSVS